MARAIRSRQADSARPPQKKALLVGINQYPPEIPSLKGCVNDAIMMAQVLQDQFGFVVDPGMRLLTDRRATKAAILERLEWLVEGARAGDILVFHYSGHGAQVRDRNGDELADGMDECLCPYEFSWDDPLLDDDLGKIVDKVPDGANLTVILDSCHSGSGLRALTAPMAQNDAFASRVKRLIPPPDIRFRASSGVDVDLALLNRSVNMRPARNLRVRRIGNSAAERGILIAGCKAEQESTDAWIDGDNHGALTYSLYQALLQLGPTTSYSNWVSVATVLLKTKYNIQNQDPQLEASTEATGWRLFSTDPAVRRHVSIAGRAATANKHIVYVHGICEHTKGFSDEWWKSVEPFVSSIPNGDLTPKGNRHEVIWSELVRDGHRDLEVRSAGQERLAQSVIDILHDRNSRFFLAQSQSEAGERSFESPGRRALLGIPGLDCIGDFMKYLLDDDIREQITKRFIGVVQPLLKQNAEIEIISHSWGTVVAYEALRAMEADRYPADAVHTFFTVGSALSIPPVRSRIRPAGNGGFSKPNFVTRWVNLDAFGDLVGGSLRDYFAVDDEYLNLKPVGCAPIFPSPACAHSSYFVSENVKVNRDIFGAMIERT